MLFNSFFFIFVFLPLSLVGWFGFNRVGMKRTAKIFLIGMSFWFYGSFALWYIPVLAISILVNFGISTASDCISRNALKGVLRDAAQREAADLHEINENDERSAVLMERSGRRQKALMLFGIAFNLAYLGVFKYGSRELSDLTGFAAALPVGLSFYTFSQISFVVERCRGEIGHDRFLNYCTAVSFFPKLAEGPITFYGEIGPQFEDPERKFFRPDSFARGMCLFVFGLAKKVLIADSLAPLVQFAYDSVYYLDTLTAAVAMVSYVFQLYFDFSGYIDMAAGISRMFNIDLPENFNCPFQATSFGRIWNRWHMTLTRFFTRYVYIPLGGSRKGAVRTALNIMAVFVLSGLWHGSGWTYLYWGVISGVLAVISNLFIRPFADRAKSEAGKFFFRLISFAMFCFVFVFFRAPDMESATVFLRRLFYPTWPGFLFRMAAKLNLPELYVINKAVSMYAPSLADMFSLEWVMLLIAVCIVLVSGRNAAQIADEMQMRKRNAVLMGCLFVWCLTSLSGVSAFLYFQY